MGILRPGNEQVITNPMQAIQLIANQLSVRISANKAENDARFQVITDILNEMLPGFMKQYDILMVGINSKNLHFAYEQNKSSGNFSATAEITKLIEAAKVTAIEMGGYADPKKNPYLKAFWDGKSDGIKMVTEMANVEV